MQKIGTGVQEKVEAALAKLFPSEPRLHSSSRTDTGVHAVGMVAHFEVPRAEFKMTPRKLALAINAHLPEDIRVLSAMRAPAKFHARFDAKGKQYRYFVWNHAAMNPLLRRTAWYVTRQLDLKAMRTAAPLFAGKHDFRSFAANPGYAKESTVRTLTRCDVKKSGPLLTFTIEGNGFLYKMCRYPVELLLTSSKCADRSIKDGAGNPRSVNAIVLKLGMTGVVGAAAVVENEGWVDDGTNVYAGISPIDASVIATGKTVVPEAFV